MSEGTAAVPAMDNKAAMIEMVSLPPPWLTQDFFKTALQDYQKDKQLEVKSDAQ